MNLIDDNKKLVYRIANNFCQHNKEFDVEDLAQVGFMTLVKSGGKFDPERGAISTFITHCVSNAIRGYLKKSKKQEAKQIKDIDVGYCPSNLDVEEYFPNSDSVEIKVCRMIQEGYNKIEISRKTNMSIWDINKALVKIKNRLRQYQ